MSKRPRVVVAMPMEGPLTRAIRGLGKSMILATKVLRRGGRG